jgi:hypothetical protein
MHPVNVRMVRGAGGDVVPFIEVDCEHGRAWAKLDKP